jgi:hypothetical protein
MSWLIIDKNVICHTEVANHINLEDLVGIDIIVERDLLIFYMGSSMKFIYSVPPEIRTHAGMSKLARTIVNLSLSADKCAVYHMSSLVDMCVENINV